LSNLELHLTQELFSISRKQKEQLNGHGSFVLWFTGLSASGKSTIARVLEQKLFLQGLRTIILDGDNTRIGINKDLDFSDQGRKENIRRVAEIAKLMNDAGVIVIASFISPFEEDRLLAKEIIGENFFIEVYVDANLQTCMARDPKGLYLLANQGKIKNFTGINSPYQIPTDPAIHLDTNKETIEESVARILAFLTNF
jgi:adenylyl-sulfate kinase